MEFCSIASGSTGNCIYIGSSSSAVLVDAGISGKKVEEGLNSFAHTAKDLNGILVTHEHSDHIKGLGVLARKHHLPFLISHDAAEPLAYRVAHEEHTSAVCTDLGY